MAGQLLIELATSGDKFYDYQLFDPINFKISGSIAKDIDYVDWNDPAKYDVTMNSDMWLSQSLGKIWWDTNSARYYRYDDYGDANGNIDINYVKRFWGKTVPGTEIVVKQWVTSEKLPDGISQFNTELYFDRVRNKTVTNYYYWTDIGEEARYSKEFSIDEIAMMIASPTTINKFFPVDGDTIIISNNAISDTFLNDFKNSIANSKIEHFEQEVIDATHILDGETTVSYTWIGDNSLTKDVIVVTVDNEIVPDNQFNINLDEITINSLVLEGQVVRVYHVIATDSWFNNIYNARDNFASSIHDVLSKRMLVTDFAMHKDYITLDHGIFNTTNWYYSDEYKTIERFAYLSQSRDIDMITMYNNGVSSFKVEITDDAGKQFDEYYFPVNNEIRLVHKTDSVLDLNFSVDLSPKQISVQIHELMNMIYEYAEVSEIKSIFFDMIEYMYTEKTYPAWIFKTSYIDLTMFNKLRKTERIYPVKETADLEVDALHHMHITKYFGEHSRFELNTIDGVDETPGKSWEDDFEVDYDNLPTLADGTYQGGKFLRNDIEYTYSADGFDTGQFSASARDSAVVKVDTFTDGTRTTLDKKEFYVYDRFGRGYHIPVVDTGTISAFDGNTLTVNQASKFKSAKGKTVQLIAIEDASGNIEFMLYDKKASTELRISERSIYTGLASDFENGDTVYVLGSPDEIYSHADT